jgi:23S rRNA (adenine2503-C2)-methyltransferase
MTSDERQRINRGNKPTSVTSLYDLSRDQLTQQLDAWDEPAYRTDQIWRWMYERHVPGIDAMSDLSKPLRAKLAEHFTLSRMSTVLEQQSTDGWTRKWLLRLADGSEVEAVLMEYEGVRRTACISSQAGCAMDCSFCATGQMGFLRNLHAGEIIEQVLWVARALKGGTSDEQERLSNVVFMGMGEPFANYANVMQAAHRLIESRTHGGMGLGARKITISTVGLVPGIRRFAEENTQLNLAVSLHAATDELRNTLVPINKRYPLREVMHAVHDYIVKTSRRVSLEWALIDGVNDTREQAEALVKLIRNTYNWQEERRHMLHVNMIPLNPTAGYAGHASQRMRIQDFCQILTRAGIPNTLRVRRGIDISAGCGQLKAEATNVGNKETRFRPAE